MYSKSQKQRNSSPNAQILWFYQPMYNVNHVTMSFFYPFYLPASPFWVMGSWCLSSAVIRPFSTHSVRFSSTPVCEVEDTLDRLKDHHRTTQRETRQKPIHTHSHLETRITREPMVLVCARKPTQAWREQANSIQKAPGLKAIVHYSRWEETALSTAMP